MDGAMDDENMMPFEAKDARGGGLRDPLDGIVVTDEYRRVRELLEGCRPVVFVTGNAGTGKSTLIQYVRATVASELAVVAPTGVAALNVGGATIHSFFRLPPRIHEEADIKRASNAELYYRLELLIVDEVSMVRADLMDSMDRFLRKNRHIDRPFGGVQLLLVGDLFQLPPVVPAQEWDVLRARGYASPYFFSSFVLQNASLASVELTHVYRQEDRSFVDLLNRIRSGDDVDAAVTEINRRCAGEGDSRSDITLTCTNRHAERINEDELAQLPFTEYRFPGKVQGEFTLTGDRLPSPMDLRLKVGAKVMFTRNDACGRWVNGSLGVVSGITAGAIRVELVSDAPGTTCDVTPLAWETHRYAFDPDEGHIVARPVGSYTQYPLMLAWAVTVHKAQGKTLDSVLIDLGTGAFASGQAYVALSRCRSIERIRLARPLRAADVVCDSAIRRFYCTLTERNR